MALPYLDAVVRETLRLYVLPTCPSWIYHDRLPQIRPPYICLSNVCFLIRAVYSLKEMSLRTRQDIVLPLGTPVKAADGRTDVHEIYLKNNTNVVVGLGPANRDPEIWGEDAHLWKPERWLGKTPEQVGKVRLPGVYSGMCVDTLLSALVTPESHVKDDIPWRRACMHVRFFFEFLH
jgi:hypothetical protein